MIARACPCSNEKEMSFNTGVRSKDFWIFCTSNIAHDIVLLFEIFQLSLQPSKEQSKNTAKYQIINRRKEQRRDLSAKFHWSPSEMPDLPR